MGIARVKRHPVETALNHTAASPLAFECLGGDEDVQVRVGVVGIDGRKLCGGSHAQHRSSSTLLVRIHTSYPYKRIAVGIALP